MPRLLLFVPCEKLVRDASSNNASIFSVLEEVHVQVPAAVGPPPQGAFAPMSWVCVSLWERDADNAENSFDAKVELLSPSGTLLMESQVLSFAFPTPRHNVAMNFAGLPIWEPGRCEVRLLLKPSSSSEFTEYQRFPIQIVHEPVGVVH
jgi:hypothetical protein